MTSFSGLGFLSEKSIVFIIRPRLLQQLRLKNVGNVGTKTESLHIRATFQARPDRGLNPVLEMGTYRYYSSISFFDFVCPVSYAYI